MDVKHPYWFVRWRTPPDAEGNRVRRSLKLGYCPTTCARRIRGGMVKATGFDSLVQRKRPVRVLS